MQVKNLFLDKNKNINLLFKSAMHGKLGANLRQK